MLFGSSRRSALRCQTSFAAAAAAPSALSAYRRKSYILKFVRGHLPQDLKDVQGAVGCLYGALPDAVSSLSRRGVAVLDIPPEADSLGQARERYGLLAAASQALVLVRPDGYVMGRWHGHDTEPLLAALAARGISP